jgi:DNA-binding response OmpR family regulator
MASAERLLLVEDDVYIQDLLQSELEEAGFEVVVASNGMRAIAALEADPNRFIAVITDINLGRGPSGWDIGRRARQLSLDIPVVYMTGSEGHHWTTEGVAKNRPAQEAIFL